MPRLLNVDQVTEIHVSRDNVCSKRQTAKDLKLDISTVRKWWNKDAPIAQLAEATDLKSVKCRFESDSGHQQIYAYILGLYLGDGYISLEPGKYNVYKLRIIQDRKYPQLIEEHKQALQLLFPNNVIGTIDQPGATNVHVYSRLLPVLFPQLGPGRKHTRKIQLQDWQQKIITNFPKEFIRGLYQSDGSRYIRTQNLRKNVCYCFTNSSMDIINLFTSTLDLLEIEWTIHSRPNITRFGYKTNSTKHTINIYKHSEVEKLEQFLQPKT